MTTEHLDLVSTSQIEKLLQDDSHTSAPTSFKTRSTRLEDWGIAPHQQQNFKNKMSNKGKKYTKQELLQLFKPIDAVPESFNTTNNPLFVPTCLEPENKLNPNFSIPADGVCLTLV